MTGQKKHFLTKLIKLLLIILALLAMAVFSLSYLWKNMKVEDYESIPTPQEKPAHEKKPSKSVMKKAFYKKRNDKMIPTNHKSDCFESKFVDPASEILTPLSNEDTMEYSIEPEATSTHLTQKLADVATKGTVDEEKVGIVKAYLQHGVDPNQVVDNNSPMFLAARSWNLPLLLELGTIDFSASTSDGWTIMHMICENEPHTEEQKKWAMDTLDYLIEQGGMIDSVNVANDYSPLMYAIEKGNTEMSIILLKHGADASGPIKKDFEVNPLMLAVKSKNMMVIIHLLDKGAHILAYNKDGISALQEAVIYGYIAGIRMFIGRIKLSGIDEPQDIQVPEPEEGEEASKERETGATMLHFAVMYNQYEVARYLISYYKVDLTLRDKKNCLALDHSRNAVNVYTDEAKRDPVQFGEAKRTAENILKLFECTEEDHKLYQEERDNQQHNRIVAHTNREHIEYQRSMKDEVIEERRRFNLL